MGKYLKQGFVRKLEWQLAREEISHSKMVELMEEECIKNYKAEMPHDKILSMTDDFVQSNRSEGQTYAHYHYDMMADFAMHILETFKTK
jgi:D-hexose-6-phosphate mutarotase